MKVTDMAVLLLLLPMKWKMNDHSCNYLLFLLAEKLQRLNERFQKLRNPSNRSTMIYRQLSKLKLKQPRRFVAFLSPLFCLVSFMISSVCTVCFVSPCLCLGSFLSPSLCLVSFLFLWVCLVCFVSPLFCLVSFLSCCVCLGFLFPLCLSGILYRLVALLGPF